MKGYISSVKDFLSTDNDKIISLLLKDYPDASSSQVESWKTLINDLKKSTELNRINDSITIAIEYELPNAGMALDLGFAGYDMNNEKHIYLIEAKQWNDDYINKHNFSIKREDEADLHPQNQVDRYKLSFGSYLSCGSKYKISTLVYIRNCSELGLNTLKDKNPKNVNKNIKMYNRIDPILLLVLNNFTYSDPSIVNELRDAVFLPSIEIMNAMHSIISKEEPFILTDIQQDVFNKVKEAIANNKKVVRIKGAAGSGKTAILLNLYVEYLDELINEPNVKTSKVKRPIFIPGNQNANMYKDIYSEVKNLFDVSFVIDKLPLTRYGNLHIIFMDEAQHNAKGLITKALDGGCILVICYDEGQRINDGDCLEELHNLEKRNDFVAINLNESIRYNGSKVAEKNIKKFLEGEKNFENDDRFIFKDHNDFDSFCNSVLTTIQNNPNSTVAVIGLLCKDASEYTFPTKKDSPFITRWNKGPNFETPESQWINYVYAKDYLNKEEGKIWVGTWWAPGLDFDYVFVLGGGDVHYDDTGLHGNIEMAKLNKTLYSIIENFNVEPSSENEFKNLIVLQKDGKVNNRRSVNNIVDFFNKKENAGIKNEFSKLYDKYIKNFYYIMMTRGKKGCEVFIANKK